MWTFAWLRRNDWWLWFIDGRINSVLGCVWLCCPVTDDHICEAVVISLILGKVDKHLQKVRGFSITETYSFFTDPSLV